MFSAITFYQVFLISALFLLKKVEVYLITPTFIIEPKFIHSLIYTSPKGRRQTHLLKTMMFLIIIFIIPQNMPHVKHFLHSECQNVRRTG